MIKTIISLLFIIIIINSSIFGVKPKYTYDVQPDTITVGDPVTVTLTLSYQSDDQLHQFSDIRESKELFILDKKSSKSEKENLITLKNIYKLTFYDVGNFEIPTVSAKFLTKHKKKETLTIPSKKILVKSTRSQESPDFTKPKYVLEALIDPIQWRPYIIGGLFLILTLTLTVYLTYLYLRYKRKQSPQKEKEVPIDLRSPEEWAYDNIKELETADYLSKNLLQEYYMKLTEILKGYLSRRYNLSISESTTEEALQCLKPLLSSMLYSEIETVLHNFDFVKFAKQIPSKSANQQALEKIKAIINQHLSQASTEEKEKI